MLITAFKPLKPHLQLFHSRVEPRFDRAQRQVERLRNLAKGQLFKLLHDHNLSQLERQAVDRPPDRHALLPSFDHS